MKQYAPILILTPWLTLSSAAAQPPSLPMSELTETQFASLDDGQRIVAGEAEITLGELRAFEAARRAAQEESERGARARARAGLSAARAAADAATSSEVRRQRALVHALLAHFQRFSAAHPQVVREARELAARRAAAQRSWLRASAPPAGQRGDARPVD